MPCGFLLKPLSPPEKSLSHFPLFDIGKRSWIDRLFSLGVGFYSCDYFLPKFPFEEGLPLPLPPLSSLSYTVSFPFIPFLEALFFANDIQLMTDRIPKAT